MTPNLSLVPLPDEGQVRKEISPIVERAKALSITRVEEHAVALEDLKAVAIMERKVVDLFREPKATAHRAHKAIGEAEKKLLLPLQEARSIISRKANDWSFEQQRLAEEKQRKLEEQAKRQAEDRKLAEAEALDKAGCHEAAEEVLSEDVEVPLVNVQPNVAKVAGISMPSRWSAVVEDKLALMRYVVGHPEWIDLVEPNMPALNKLAVSLKKGFNVPGCRAVETRSFALRA